MEGSPATRYEVPGVVFVFVAGAVAIIISALLTPLLGKLDTGWLFVGVAGVALAWALLTEGSASPTDEREVEVVEEDTAAEEDDGEHILDVALLDWANALVGTECARCEEEITYVSLRSAEGASDHRIACGCTRIEAGSLS